MTNKNNTKSLLLFFLIFFVFSNLTNAQTASDQLRKSRKHFLYLNTDNKVACTQDLQVIETARLLRQNLTFSNQTIQSRNPLLNQDASQSVASASFIVTYDAGFNANPDARAAFKKAVDIWATLVTSSAPIRINAVFDILGMGVLGSTSTNEDLFPFTGTTRSWTSTALIESLVGFEVYSGFDIDISFNSAEPNFDFGLIGSPEANKIDFVSVVLHEIGHGLGFTGSGRVQDTDLPCDGTTIGCWGYDDISTVPIVYFPEIYDRFVQSNAGTSILTLTNPSVAVSNVVLSNSLFFDSPIVRSVNGGSRARLYAPTTYEPGSSYSHFSEFTFNNTANALMTPFLDFGEVQQNLGPVGCALLKTIGWNMSGACAAALPIELSNFQAANKGNRNILTWTTLTELNNKMFKIERSYDGKNFTEIGEVKGAGTTEFPRSYTFYDEGPLSISYYRLRQIDFDGKTKPSNIVSVSLNKNSDITLFPNPTKDKIAFNTTAFEPNRVVVYNNLGQIVMDKTYQINELDVSSLPTGLYVLELTSDNLKVNKRFVKN
jgi:Secretion system C-terminal sorting domain